MSEAFTTQITVRIHSTLESFNCEISNTMWYKTVWTFTANTQLTYIQIYTQTCQSNCYLMLSSQTNIWHIVVKASTCRFLLQERGFWKLNFRTGGRKPPEHNPVDREVLNQGVMSGGLRPPILKFSFQVGDVWFCGFIRLCHWTVDSDPGGLCPAPPGGVMSGHRSHLSTHVCWV